MGDQREPTADRHAGHTELGKFADRRNTRKHQHVDRHRDVVDNRLDLVGGRDPGGVHDVGPGCGVRLQSGERVVEVVDAPEVVLGTGSEHEAHRTSVGGLGRRGDPVDGQLVVVDGLAVGVPVLDRASGESGGCGGGDGLGNAVGIRREAMLEIGTDRQRRRRGEVGTVGDRLLTSHLTVVAAERVGESGARRGQRGVAEVGEDLGATWIPGVGHQQRRATLMQGGERSGPFSGEGQVNCRH